MKKHQATWLLAILVALGAAQAVPLSSLQRSLETCAIVQAVKVRREQYVRRERAIRGYTNQDSRVSHSNDLPAVIRHFGNARLLRAPPLSSIA
jgi:hypothetical protein